MTNEELRTRPERRELGKLFCVVFLCLATAFTCDGPKTANAAGQAERTDLDRPRRIGERAWRPCDFSERMTGPIDLDCNAADVCTVCSSGECVTFDRKECRR